MIEAAGLGVPKGKTLLHHGGPVEVEVWPLEADWRGGIAFHTRVTSGT